MITVTVDTSISMCFSVQCFKDVSRHWAFPTKAVPASPIHVMCFDSTSPSHSLCAWKVCRSALLNSAFKFLFWIILPLSSSLFLSVLSVFVFFETKPGIPRDPDICLPPPPECWDKKLAPPRWLYYYSLYHIRIILLFCFDLWGKVFLCICSQCNLDFSVMPQFPKY